MINPMEMPQSFMAAEQSPIIRNPERPRSTVTTPNQPQDMPLSAATQEGRRLRLTPSQLRSVSAAKAVAREEDRKIKRRQERDQEAERGLMAAEDATSFMTQGAMANDPFMTPLQPIDVPTPISSPMNDPFSPQPTSRKSFGRSLTFM